MPLRLNVTQRALAAGVAAAGLLIGAFAAGGARGDAATLPGRTVPAQAAAPGARITVTGTGAVSGTPDQLMLYMGVQTDGSLQRANRAVSAVTRALTRTGVRGSDIQTSGLSIQPDYTGNSTVPAGYGVGESIDVTLRTLAAAGTQISDAVRAGGNATQVDGISLNLNDTSSLLAAARAKAAADARTKAGQYARALGLSLGPVVSVSEQHPAPVLPMFAAPSAGRAAASPVPVSPGSQQVTVTVTVVYALG
jgi:uncharacterized protein YggE